LGKIKGLIVGHFNGVKEHTGFGGTTYELIQGIVKKYGIPACFGFPVGHSEDNFPLIEGNEVTFSVNEGGVDLIF
jgi:muramoyltetrapeptide carboxypeptidase